MPHLLHIMFPNQIIPTTAPHQDGERNRRCRESLNCQLSRGRVVFHDSQTRSWITHPSVNRLKLIWFPRVKMSVVWDDDDDVCGGVWWSVKVWDVVWCGASGRILIWRKWNRCVKGKNTMLNSKTNWIHCATYLNNNFQLVLINKKFSSLSCSHGSHDKLFHNTKFQLSQQLFSVHWKPDKILCTTTLSWYNAKLHHVYFIN